MRFPVEVEEAVVRPYMIEAVLSVCISKTQPTVSDISISVC
jgi:hypothetical protein